MADAGRGRFTFQVDSKANKTQISAQIARIFGVHPVAIRTIAIPGKLKRSVRTRKYIRRSAGKKAIVRLKNGEKIPLFDLTEGQNTT